MIIESAKYNRTIIRVRHHSVPKYLSAIRSKVAEFGKEALTSYEEPRELTLGFRCGDEVHVVGLNNIREHYNIERILPPIPGLVLIKRNTSSTISQEKGIAMFTKDCKDALNSNHH